MDKKRFRWIRPTVVDIRKEMPPILCSDKEQAKRYLNFLNAEEKEKRNWKEKYFKTADLLMKETDLIDNIHDICILSDDETAQTIINKIKEKEI